MTSHRSRALGLGTQLIVMLTICHPALSHFKFLSAENEAYKVELIRWERYGAGYGDVRFVLLVRDKETSGERTVTIENPTTGLEKAEIVDGTLVLFGEVQSLADSVTLVDLRAAKVTDFILHYGASFSPSRTYLAFKAFYPPYGMLQNRSDTVRIYDLSQGPSENRLPGAADSTTGHNVGIPVYPPENVDPPTYLIWVLEESHRHYISAQAGFLWTKDERSLFFIDRTGGLVDETDGDGQQLLVRVDLDEKRLRQPRITTRPIDGAPALATDPQKPEQPLTPEHRFLAVTGMEFEADGQIRLELDRKLFERNIYRVTHMTVTPPEAAPPIQEQPEEQP